MRKSTMDVISLPIELDEKLIDGRYRFVLAAIKRAKELHMGALPKAGIRARKATTTAIEEVASGSVRVLTGRAAIKAREDASKLTYEHMMDEASQKVSFTESLTELEKDLEDYLIKKKKIGIQ